jgi:hypothetical protein
MCNENDPSISTYSEEEFIQHFNNTAYNDTHYNYHINYTGYNSSSNVPLANFFSLFDYFLNEHHKNGQKIEAIDLVSTESPGTQYLNLSFDYKHTFQFNFKISGFKLFMGQGEFWYLDISESEVNTSNAPMEFHGFKGSIQQIAIFNETKFVSKYNSFIFIDEVSQTTDELNKDIVIEMSDFDSEVYNVSIKFDNINRFKSFKIITAIEYNGKTRACIEIETHYKVKMTIYTGEGFSTFGQYDKFSIDVCFGINTTINIPEFVIQYTGNEAQIGDKFYINISPMKSNGGIVENYYLKTGWSGTYHETIPNVIYKQGTDNIPVQVEGETFYIQEIHGEKGTVIPLNYSLPFEVNLYENSKGLTIFFPETWTSTTCVFTKKVRIFENVDPIYFGGHFSMAETTVYMDFDFKYAKPTNYFDFKLRKKPRVSWTIKGKNGYFLPQKIKLNAKMEFSGHNGESTYYNNEFPFHFEFYQGETGLDFPYVIINGSVNPRGYPKLNAVFDFVPVNENEYLSEDNFTNCLQNIENGRIIAEEKDVAYGSIFNEPTLSLTHTQPGFWAKQASFRLKGGENKVRIYNLIDRSGFTNKVCIAYTEIDQCDDDAAIVDIRLAIIQGKEINYDKFYYTTGDMKGIKLQLLYGDVTHIDLKNLWTNNNLKAMAQNKNFIMPILISSQKHRSPVNITGEDVFSKECLRLEGITLQNVFGKATQTIILSHCYLPNTGINKSQLSQFIQWEIGFRDLNFFKDKDGIVILGNSKVLIENINNLKGFVFHENTTIKFSALEGVGEYWVVVSGGTVMIDVSRQNFTAGNELFVINNIHPEEYTPKTASIGVRGFSGIFNVDLEDNTTTPFEELRADKIPSFTFENSRDITFQISQASIPKLKFDIAPELQFQTQMLISMTVEKTIIDFGNAFESVNESTIVSIPRALTFSKRSGDEIGIILLPCDKIEIHIDSLVIDYNTTAEFSTLVVKNNLTIGTNAKLNTYTGCEACGALGERALFKYNAEDKVGAVKISNLATNDPPCGGDIEFGTINIAYDSLTLYNPMNVSSFIDKYFTQGAPGSSFLENVPTSVTVKLANKNMSQVFIPPQGLKNWDTNSPNMSIYCSGMMNNKHTCYVKLDSEMETAEEAKKAAFHDESDSIMATPAAQNIDNLSANGLILSIVVFAVVIIIVIVVWVVMKVKYGATVNRNRKAKEHSKDDSLSFSGD